MRQDKEKIMYVYILFFLILKQQVFEEEWHGVHPQNGIPGVFFCIFQKNSAMATLGLKEMGKFL